MHRSRASFADIAHTDFDIKLHLGSSTACNNDSGHEVSYHAALSLRGPANETASPDQAKRLTFFNELWDVLMGFSGHATAR